MVECASGDRGHFLLGFRSLLLRFEEISQFIWGRRFQTNKRGMLLSSDEANHFISKPQTPQVHSRRPRYLQILISWKIRNIQRNIELKLPKISSIRSLNARAFGENVIIAPISVFVQFSGKNLFPIGRFTSSRKSGTFVVYFEMRPSEKTAEWCT